MAVLTEGEGAMSERLPASGNWMEMPIWYAAACRMRRLMNAGVGNEAGLNLIEERRRVKLKLRECRHLSEFRDSVEPGFPVVLENHGHACEAAGAYGVAGAAGFGVCGIDPE